MKRVAVLTFHRANNYGALLQAHALSHVINRLGANGEVLDYRPCAMETFYHSFIPRVKRVKSFLLLLLYRIFRDAKTRRRFAEFRRDMMRVSAQVYRSLSELKMANELYDVFIVGSDQVWNPEIAKKCGEDSDLAYLLDFVQDAGKKKSYAASIGVSVLNDQTGALYRDKLSDFSTISVREHNAAELLAPLLNRQVRTVCDPVLLMSAEEWAEFERPYKLPNNDYILVYSVGGGRELLPYAGQLAAQERCAVYSIQPPIVGTASYCQKQRLTGVGPAEFIWLIHHARAVVTSSFHGSAFSLLFQKELHVRQESRLKQNHRNSRFDSLFKYFCVTDVHCGAKEGIGDDFIVILPEGQKRSVFECNRSAALDFLRFMIQ